MYETMLSDISEFLRAVAVETGSLVAPHTLQTRETGEGYWYVWIGPNGQHKDNYPQLWLKKTDGAVIVPGHMKMVAGAPRAPKDSWKTLADVAMHPKCAVLCKPLAGGPWSLFGVEIDVKFADDSAVTHAATAIANILLALDEAYPQKLAEPAETT
jgi:hypothetical protein